MILLFLPLLSQLEPPSERSSCVADLVGKVILEPCGGPLVCRARKTQVRFGRRSVKLTL